MVGAAEVVVGATEEVVGVEDVVEGAAEVVVGAVVDEAAAAAEVDVSDGTTALVCSVAAAD